MSVSARLRGVALVLGFALALTSCAAIPEAEVVDEAASTEQTTQERVVEPVADNYVILYSGRNESLVQPLIDSFTEQTGIAVDIRYAGSSELAAQILEEGADSPAAVFLSQDAGALGALSLEGLFAELPAEITDRVNPAFTSHDDSWVGITGRARVVVYDSETLSVEQLPNTADEIVGPQWSGKVGVAPGNASFQSFVTAYRVMKGDSAADQWVSGLNINDPQIFESNGAILDAVNEGTLPIGLINHYYWERLAFERGAENLRAKLHFTDAGDPASIVNVTGMGLLDAQSFDLDALELIAFFVSDEAQQYFVEQTFEYPLLPTIDAPEGLPALDDLAVADFDLSDLATLKETQDLLRKYGLIL
ncbi:MAG: extracellular solute-binding protein [Pontimonas sp.]|nr:extracellular solute-binding protein [Pontimonas sp.]